MVKSSVIERNRYRKEIYDFLNNVSFDNPLSITLTEKVVDPINPIIGQRKIDNIKSSINTKHFLNRVNQKVFKNSFQRCWILIGWQEIYFDKPMWVFSQSISDKRSTFVRSLSK